MLYSEALENQIRIAPEQVKAALGSVPEQSREFVELSDDMENLADAYLKVGVVGERWREDCQHVAAATVAHADAIVSWNFKHLMRLDRIRAVNAVNLAEGYGMIAIVSPKEVNFDER